MIFYYTTLLHGAAPDCGVVAVDICGEAIDVAQAGRFTRVESDEPEDDSLEEEAIGDGHTCRDIEIAGPHRRSRSVPSARAAATAASTPCISR